MTKLGSAGRPRIIAGTRVMTALNATTPIAWYWNRWCQLALGVVAMMAISSPQYVWTLFTGPLNQKLGTTLAELQWTFSLLIILQTWCSPLQAYLGRSLWSAIVDLGRSAFVRRRLGALQLRQQSLGTLFHLRV